MSKILYYIVDDINFINNIKYSSIQLSLDYNIYSNDLIKYKLNNHKIHEKTNLFITNDQYILESLKNNRCLLYSSSTNFINFCYEINKQIKTINEIIIITTYDNLLIDILNAKIVNQIYIYYKNKVYIDQKQFIKYYKYITTINVKFVSDILNIHDSQEYKVNIHNFYNKNETKYLETVSKIIEKGVYNLDRTNVGTKCLFGKTIKYDLRNNILPLFTSRKMFSRGIIEELLFFISGSSNTKILENKKVNIWKGNTSREFLDSRGLNHFEEGEYGESYGFNLRHYGAEYKGLDYDYTNKGIDQLQNVVDLIKNNPTSRRILFTFHNPETVDRIPLPACHVLYQFYIDINTNELSCSFYQRSSDFCLAANYNVVSCSLLVYMLCHICNLKPGKVIHNVGNIHIYMNHIEEAKKMLQNEPMPFPLLYIDDPQNEIKTIDDFKYEHFKILFYKSHKTHKFEMAI